MKKKTIGNVFMTAGLLCCLAAVALVFYNVQDTKRAEEVSQAVVADLVEKIEQQNDVGIMNPERDMPSTEVEGYSYVGILSIPALDLSLPVMKEWNYENLKNAPCVYRGSVYSDDMIIAAHNYGKHFGNLKKLPIGTEVVFQDIENAKYQYEVVEINLIEGTDVEEMVAGEWDLTMFTCTLDGQKRYTVRCERVIRK